MLCDKNRCTGCMSCYSACAFGAIQLIEDEMGVLHPTIDKALCRNCGKCTAACPILHPPVSAHPSQAWAMYTRNDGDRQCCSSGGVATTLYRKVLHEGGVVFGAGFDEGGMPILKAARTESEIEAFRGSKYVYAFPSLVYREVEQVLKSSKLCLFVGTPCQVAGLRAYLKRDPENLLTVDLVCHGTPPQAYLKQHLDRCTKGAAIGGVHFRGARGWRLVVCDRDGDPIFEKQSGKDPYYTAFLRGLTYREVCFSCPYATDARVSDITVGDFWGLGADALDGYTGRVSLALCNTERGTRLLQAAQDLFYSELRTVEEAVAGNEQLRHPTKPPVERARFAHTYRETGDLTKALCAAGIHRVIRRARVRDTVLAVPRFVKHRILKK